MGNNYSFYHIGYFEFNPLRDIFYQLLSIFRNWGNRYFGIIYWNVLLSNSKKQQNSGFLQGPGFLYRYRGFVMARKYYSPFHLQQVWNNEYQP